MSTETGPDLSVAVSAITALMDDTCDLYVYADAEPAGVLNEETLEIVNGAPNPPAYSGRCKVKQASGGVAGNVSRHAEEGDRKQRTTLYELSIPLFDDAGNPVPAPVAGMRAVCTSSRRSPALVGRVFRIYEVIASTFQTQWKCICESREGETL